jgi:hypothetical protein
VACEHVYVWGGAETNAFRISTPLNLISDKPHSAVGLVELGNCGHRITEIGKRWTHAFITVKLIKLALIGISQYALFIVYVGFSKQWAVACPICSWQCTVNCVYHSEKRAVRRYWCLHYIRYWTLGKIIVCSEAWEQAQKPKSLFFIYLVPN